jgi:hypothetical protein
VEELSEGVFGAERRGDAVEGFEGPGDVQGGIVPEDGTFASGMVEVGGFVKDFCGVGEHEEAVGETLRDPQELEIVVHRLGFQVKAGPLAEVRGVAAEVDSDVPDVS